METILCDERLTCINTVRQYAVTGRLPLFAYWRASYLLEGAPQDQGSEFADAMLMLSIGAFCILLGRDIVISDACAYPLPPGGTSIQWERELAEVTKYVQERGWCAALGYSFLLLGSGFSWPTLKLLFGALSKKTLHPPL